MSCTTQKEQKAGKFFVFELIAIVIIGELVWDQEEVESQRHFNMFASYKVVDDGNISDRAEFQDDPGVGSCNVNLHTPLQLTSVVDYLRVGLSFRHIAGVLQHNIERTGLAFLRNCKENLKSKHACLARPISLQKMSNLLEGPYAWTFFVASDMSTQMSICSLDNHPRQPLQGALSR